MRSSISIRPGRVFAIWVGACVVLAAGLQAGHAATLGEVLDSIAGNPGHLPPCLEVTVAETVPNERPVGRCSTNIVGGLYLGLLRDRERLDIVRAAIARQRDLLAALQKRLQGGAGSRRDSLLAEIELKRWQRKEAELVSAVLHAELFFKTILVTESTKFVRPRVAPSAWPKSETVALADLAQEPTIPDQDRSAVETLLKHAWIDYETARRDIALLQPMGAFTQDLVKASQQMFELGQLGITELQDRWRDADEVKDALVSAEYHLLALQLAILELLGQRDAID